MTLVNLPAEHVRILQLCTTIALATHGLTTEQRRLIQGARIVLRHSLEDPFEPWRSAARDSGAELSATTTVKGLAELWLDELIIEGRVKQQTINGYGNDLHHLILPAIGDMSIGELTVGSIDRYLKTVARTHPAGARRCKHRLQRMFSMAVRHGAIAVNPVREVGRLPNPRKAVRAITPEEVREIRAALQVWTTKRARGPKKTRVVADVFDLLLATGCRIGEACALRWQDIDLDSGLLTVAGTMVFIKTVGWHRQDELKTGAGLRRVHLPPFAVALLRGRYATEPHGPDDPVFPTRRDTFVQPDNVRRSLRDALKHHGGDLKWVSPHSFRRTVATALSGQGLIVEAAAQLGHTDEAFTRKVYVERSTLAPDVSAVLEGLITQP